MQQFPMRAVVVPAVLALCTTAAAADPVRGSVFVDLRLHVGDTEQDEVAHYGLSPSIILGGSIVLGRGFEIAASLAAAKLSASWENIGGLANGLLELQRTVRGRSWRAMVSAGLAFPLDRSLPAPECFEPDRGPGDSLVLSYGTSTACWDRSAYRRAALHRGAWDIWMWAPDWVSVPVTARFEGTGSRNAFYAIDAGVAIAMPVTAAHDDPAVILQIAPEVGVHLSPRWLAGVRAIAAGVVLDRTSPFMVSLEPYAEYAHAAVRVRFSLLLPLADLRNEDVSPGLGGYQPIELYSLGVQAGVLF
ncbi:hypothetical protein BH11MYX3_BH11MYX3_04350 [soil metagenome]